MTSATTGVDDASWTARGPPRMGGGLLRLHLHQVKQVSEVCAKVICCALIIFLIPNTLVFKPRLPQLHCHLSDRFGNTGPCRAVDAGFETR